MTTSSDNRAPAPVTKPGFYEVRTPDPERLVHYYQDALGLVVTERSGTTTYLTTGIDHHCVIVQPGCELPAELTAAGPGSPVSAGTEGIQPLPDSRLPPGSSQVTA